MKRSAIPFLAALLATAAAPASAQVGSWPPIVPHIASSPPTFNWATGSSIEAPGTSVVTNSTGHTITSGDLQIVLGGPTDDATTSFSVFTVTGGGTWTCPTPSTGSNPETTTFFNHIETQYFCWRIAGVGETGAYTIAWTGASNRNTLWTLIDIAAGTFNAATPIADSGADTMNSTTQSFDAPSVNAATNHDLTVSVYPLWNNSDAADPATKTAGMTLKLNTFDASYEPEVLDLTSTQGASGATGVKNVTTTNAGGTVGQGWNLDIKGL